MSNNISSRNHFILFLRGEEGRGGGRAGWKLWHREKTLAAELLEMLSANECPGPGFVLENLMESLSR